MTPNGFASSVIQAAVCIAAVAALRIAVIWLGPKIGAILLGAPIIMVPLLAMQAWQGPSVTQNQTIGSIASMMATTASLWLLRLPLNFSPRTSVAIVSIAWLAIIVISNLTGLASSVMAIFIIANGLFILTTQRNHRPTVAVASGKITHGAMATGIFIVGFFLLTRIVPDFVRGVLVGFPLGILATLYFVRRILPIDAFRDFVMYTHGAILANSMFVLVVHLMIAYVPIASALAVSLLVSLMMSFIVSHVWRAPRRV